MSSSEVWLATMQMPGNQLTVVMSPPLPFRLDPPLPPQLSTVFLVSTALIAFESISREDCVSNFDLTC